MVLIAPDVGERSELFLRFGKAFYDAHLVESPEIVVERLLEREAVLSTGIGGGVAVPHAQVPHLGRLALAASTHPQGLAYPSLDEKPVRLVFCLLGDANTSADHLAGLARLARLARRGEALMSLVGAPDGTSFVEELKRLEES
jgi:PTS system nitrogen regulatory IIA component